MENSDYRINKNQQDLDLSLVLQAMTRVSDSLNNSLNKMKGV